MTLRPRVQYRCNFHAESFAYSSNNFTAVGLLMVFIILVSNIFKHYLCKVRHVRQVKVVSLQPFFIYVRQQLTRCPFVKSSSELVSAVKEDFTRERLTFIIDETAWADKCVINIGKLLLQKSATKNRRK